MPESASVPAVFMYIGNLEPYQGIDLLLKSFALLRARRPQDRLVIIGGTPAAVTHYRGVRERLGLPEESVDMRGAQPVARMAEFFTEADVLVSPRIHGTNTPMKIYSYMDSGKPVVATDLFTHTQVLDAEVAVLAAPEPAAFAAAMGRVAGDAGLRAALAGRARAMVREKYSTAAFRRSLGEIYDYVEACLRAPAGG